MTTLVELVTLADRALENDPPPAVAVLLEMMQRSKRPKHPPPPTCAAFLVRMQFVTIGEAL